ncbi:hypothetical protein H2198_003411 [Neophaeococcomyces mojaviensis]|uniref:Uncharacterized protein n=1 Tax=Neophaeococcomyces mojaviensis TaxID=3383035 RepID=A0ACC3ABG8_9EURO|nr:hypothetical protein H2198_003411 [Knufia sp. JES_112]
MEPPTIPNLEFVTLPNHPDCPIAYTLTALHNHLTLPSPVRSRGVLWIIFLNGLGLPQAFWQPTIQLLHSDVEANPASLHDEIYVTTYDRYGQGFSRPQQISPTTKIAPADPTWKPDRHDCLDSVHDLAQLVEKLSVRVLTEGRENDKRQFRILLVGQSLGVPIARLFADKHGDHVAALMLIDSNMANVNMVNLLPDPDAPEFNADQLPEDTSVEQLRRTRDNYTKLFAPTAPNAENLDRSTLLDLLPRSDTPALGRDGKRVLLTVVAHDPEAFAEEGLKISTRGLTEGFIEPAWWRYNLGLLRLDGETEEDVNASAIVVAKDAGHFVQRDNPRCVVDEIWKLVKKL